jgi:hypothetical protein
MRRCLKGIWRATAALVALVCVAALTVPANADQPAVSKVTLKVAGGPPFHGRVISESLSCIANRKVVLLEVAPDRGPIDYADNRTNGMGKWVFSSQLQGATVVRAKVARSKSSGVICRAAFSPSKRALDRAVADRLVDGELVAAVSLGPVERGVGSDHRLEAR